MFAEKPHWPPAQKLNETPAVDAFRVHDPTSPVHVYAVYCN